MLIITSEGCRKAAELGTRNSELRTPNSRPPWIIVAMNGWPLLADSLEGVRSVGAVKWC